MKKYIIPLVVAVAAILIALALFLYRTGNQQVGRLEGIKQAGKITMGCNANYPPFEFHKKIDGEDAIVGFDVMIGKEIAKDLGVELEISDMEFSSVLASLDTGMIDMAISGVSKSKEREASMDFSIPYYRPENYLLVQKKDLGKYRAPEAIKQLTVGVQTATLQEEIAKELGVEGLVSLPKTPDLVAQLDRGLIDGIVMEQCVADNYAITHPNLAVEKSFAFEAEVDGTAVGLKKGDDALKAQIDKTLKRLEEEGKLESYYNEALALSAE